LSNIDLDKDSFYTISNGSGELIVNVYNIKNTDWAFIHIEPISRDIYDNMIILYINIIILLSLITAIVIISVLFVRRFTKPLKQLQGKIGSVKSYNFFENKPIKGDKEFIKLANNFEQMMIRLYELNKQVKEKEKEKFSIEKRRKEAEIIALQAQMNPHFLSNIFVSLSFLLRLNMISHAEKMFAATGELFRVGMYKGSSIISVQEEIEHVNAYIKIQQFRYSNKINFSMSVNDSILQLKIPKFILQPLVENSIEHGLGDKKCVNINIIFEYLADDKLRIEVTDDGIGIDGNKLLEIQNYITSESSSLHVGLRNINERIRLNFGQEYGLSLTSEKGIGTRAVIVLPVIK